MEQSFVITCFMCLILCTGGRCNEVHMDMTMEARPGSSTTCGVLNCSESVVPGNVISDNGHNTISTTTGTISSISIFKRDQTSISNYDGTEDRGSHVASLTPQQPNITTVTDEVKVDGYLEPEQANLCVEMYKEEDCHAEYTCEVRSVDDKGNEIVTVNRMRPKAESQGDDRQNGSSNLEKLLENLDKKLTLLGTNLETKMTNLEEEFRQLKSSVINHNPDTSSSSSSDSSDSSDSNDADDSISSIRDLFAETNEEIANTIRNVMTNLSTPQTCSKGMASILSQSTFPYPVIRPSDGSNLDIPYLCETVTDGGGWIVIQRRTTGNTNFYRNWAEYKNGFGPLDDDFWLGNKNIHALTCTGTFELRVDLRYNGKSAFAHYSSFSLDSEANNYALRLGAYDGTAGDSLHYHRNQPFSTYDRDNDNSVHNCASAYKGAWWYARCHWSNLNGQWGLGLHKGPRWATFSSSSPVSFTEMKIRLVS